MAVAETDDQGRIIRTKNRIELIPISADPLDNFQEPENKKPVDELNENIRGEAAKQATDNVR
jgi:hypothetical protein